MKLVLVALFATASCAPHATEAILTVSNADLDVPGEIDSIQIEVHQVDAAGPVLSSVKVKPCAPGEHGDGCKNFPFTVLFVPGDHPDTRAFIELRAVSGNTIVIDDAFVLAFISGQTLRYDLVLFRACLLTRCADQAEVCNAAGQCAPLASGNATAGDAAAADLAAVDSSSASFDALLPPRRVFLTTAAFFGNFGGPAGGNKKCSDEATTAGLIGNFVAILGLSTMSPKSYLVLDGGTRPIVRTDGKQVATDDTFWEATHDNLIDVGADKQPVPQTGTLSQNVWTGFDYHGATVSGGTCGDWTSITTGYFGDPYGIATGTGTWASYAAQGNCTSNYPMHLYCIEQ